jgi:hypothetical protein
MGMQRDAQDGYDSTTVRIFGKGFLSSYFGLIQSIIV